MKLSMWTICARLKDAGYTVVPAIAEGLPRITAFRQAEENSYSADRLELIPASQIPGAAAEDVALVNDMDYLLVRQADRAGICNCLNETFEYYDHWENGLYARMVDGASLQELLDAGSEAFHRPMFIKNDSSWTFAITRGYPADIHPYWAKLERSVGKHTSEFDTVRAVSTDPEFQNIFLEKYPSVSRSPAYGAMILHANIFLSGRRVAEIIALENGVPFDPGEVHVMHALAELVEKYIRSNTEKLISVSDPAIFLSELIEDREPNLMNLPIIYRSTGLSPQEGLLAAVVEGKNRTDTPMLAVLRDGLETQLKRAVVFSYRNQVVCLLGLGQGRGYAQAMKQLGALIPSDAFLWGASYEFEGLETLSEHYTQACAALEQAEKQRRPFASLYDVGVACMAERCDPDGSVRAFSHPDLARLREADEKENARYCETLFEYLLCGGNYTDAASRLGLHRNSLIYRMNKIRAIMRSNPDDLENRKLLLFSFLLSSDG